MSQEDLVRYLEKNTRALQNPRVEEAFRAVDRKFFVPKELQSRAYEDYPLPIGHGATISQPTTVAFMLEKLDVQEGQKILDIGSGSGWTTALLSHLVGPKGKVIGLEIVPQLVELGKENLRNWYSLIRTNKRIVADTEIRQTEMGVIGLPEEAPFERILVSAAGKKVPKGLVEQLKPNGTLVIPVNQSIFRISRKPDGIVETEEYPGFVFVPLR